MRQREGVIFFFLRELIKESAQTMVLHFKCLNKQQHLVPLVVAHTVSHNHNGTNLSNINVRLCNFTYF